MMLLTGLLLAKGGNWRFGFYAIEQLDGGLLGSITGKGF